MTDLVERLSGFGFGEDAVVKIADLGTPPFQRNLKARRTASWRFFIPALFGRIIVAVVDGVLMLVDGQHRVAHAKAHGQTEVPAVLFKEISLRDAAAMYDLSNSERVALPAADEFRAAVMAEDPAAVELDAALLKRNLDGWCRGRAGKDNNLTAIASVRKLQVDHGTDLALYALDLINEVWPSDEVGSPHTRLIRGVGQFVRPEKRIKPLSGGKPRLRRWKDADRPILVAYLKHRYGDRDGLADILTLAQAKRLGGGGGGGSAGMEQLLAEMLRKARTWHKEQQAVAA